MDLSKPCCLTSLEFQSSHFSQDMPREWLYPQLATLRTSSCNKLRTLETYPSQRLRPQRGNGKSVFHLTHCCYPLVMLQWIGSPETYGKDQGTHCCHGNGRVCSGCSNNRKLLPTNITISHHNWEAWVWHHQVPSRYISSMQLLPLPPPPTTTPHQAIKEPWGARQHDKLLVTQCSQLRHTASHFPWGTLTGQDTRWKGILSFSHIHVQTSFPRPPRGNTVTSDIEAKSWFLSEPSP